jgi:hypothetical protein
MAGLNGTAGLSLNPALVLMQVYYSSYAPLMLDMYNNHIETLTLPLEFRFPPLSAAEMRSQQYRSSL